MIFDNSQVSAQKVLCDSCISNLTNPNSWISRGPCYDMLGSISKNDINYVYLKLFMQDLFNQYYVNGCRIVSNFDSSSYNPLQTQLYNSCRTFDNVCEFALSGNPWNGSTGYCKRTDIIPNTSVFNTNPQLGFFCSCFLPSGNYIPTIPIECDSLCGLSQSIKLFDIDNNRLVCQSNVCSISDVTLNITKSTTGEINFKQLCSGVCGDISCSSCFLNNINIDVINSTTGDINFYQNCGGSNPESSFVCWENNNGNYISVPCSNVNTKQTVETSYIVFIVISSFVFFIMFIFLVYLISKNRSFKI